MKRIAIIPARSGSKGVKDKNIREIAGKPLIAYTIEAALKSKIFDEVMVSTDSEKYAEIARKYGAKVPFLRSEKTATDQASSWDMVKEVLECYSDRGIEFDAFCLLQPTSPLRDANDIKAAYNIFQGKKAVAVVSVCEAEHSPLLFGTLDKNNSLNGFIKANNNVRRQDAGIFYRLNGAIYMVDIKEFYKECYLYREGSFAYVMDTKKSVDIDSEVDFEYAEFLLKSDNPLFWVDNSNIADKSQR